MKKIVLFILLSSVTGIFAQQIEPLSQFAGRYDYIAIGNTMNVTENDPTQDCIVLTTSTAELTLQNNQTVIAAYLYWAGSGQGDLNVTLNGTNISAERTFNDAIDDQRVFFGGFTDVTSFVQTSGNGPYTLSNLDVSAVIDDYCPTATNFAGWSIVIVYEDPTLPLNQVNVFDGFESVFAGNTQLNITLENLNVIDNEDAKIGFLAWEGDSALAVNETLSINGQILSNLPLNPSANAFNGTNSFTDSNELYNMDIDFFNIQNTINPGDDTALIQLTSGQDYVIVNNIITVLNSQVPDATVSIINTTPLCLASLTEVTYTVSNTLGTDPLPQGIPIAFYADDIFLFTVPLEITLLPGQSTQQTTDVTIPAGVPPVFTLVVVADDAGGGNGTVAELDEENNSDSIELLNPSPFPAGDLEDIFICDEPSNDGVVIADLTPTLDIAQGDVDNISISFHLSEDEAIASQNPISPISEVTLTEPQQTIYVRVEDNTNDSCFSVTPFDIFIIYQPVVQDIFDLSVCDDTSNDESALFDLTEVGEAIVGGQAEVTLSFFANAEDAQQAMNELQAIEAFTNTSNPQEIFVRLENAEGFTCEVIDSFLISVLSIPEVETLTGLTECNEGNELATFNLQDAEAQFINDLSADEFIQGYYLTQADASFMENEILMPSQYQNTGDPQEIFIRIGRNDEGACYTVKRVVIQTENCPPFIPQGFSPNGDGVNDTFDITGLYDIFKEFEVQVFNRYGSTIYKGNNDIPAWDGTPNEGLGGNELPTGTYYYILNLNDPDYPEPYKGWVYLNR
ncbi:hypothetical protein GCM10009117_07430 [Gangjinia marincola]|uniref:Gliding motility-associated C-terminal domain-containing protein n=1 Tax=Gangjinia marincola TaxID=578463 RepID=A0ABN1MEP5_9FLAO